MEKKEMTDDGFENQLAQCNSFRETNIDKQILNETLEAENKRLRKLISDGIKQP